MTGYASLKYAESFREFGTPHPLPCSKGWLLQRPVPGLCEHDAMGCYPLFSCLDWSALARDLAELQEELLCVSLVPDPLDDVPQDLLQETFPDVFIPMKEHFLADLSLEPERFVDRHHRYYARRALRTMSVDVAADPATHLDEWESLYDCLRQRHALKGIKAFSRDCFAEQLAVPGTVLLRARVEEETVGAQIWYRHSSGAGASSHLTAVSERGYDLRATYAIYWKAIEYWADRVRWLNFGAGAGTQSDGTDGLTVFKRGWSTDTRTAYFCGKILSKTRYREIVAERNLDHIRYFPAYRVGEF